MRPISGKCNRRALFTCARATATFKTPKMEATLAMVAMVAAVESLARKSCKVHFAFAFALKRKGRGEIEERGRSGRKNKDRLAEQSRNSRRSSDRRKREKEHTAHGAKD